MIFWSFEAPNAKWRSNITYCACHEKWCANSTKYCVARKSDAPTSPNTLPATRSDRRTTPNTLSLTGQHHQRVCLPWKMWQLLYCTLFYSTQLDYILLQLYKSNYNFSPTSTPLYFPLLCFTLLYSSLSYPALLYTALICDGAGPWCLKTWGALTVLLGVYACRHGTLNSN